MLSAYKPKSPADFIGSARSISLKLEKLVQSALPDGDPLKILLLGKPGIGKTALANWLMNRLGCDRWHTTVLNGTQVKIELVEEIARTLQFKELFGQYRILRIEEVDKVPTVAQVRFLTLLDDLPSRTAVICTSNCDLKDLEERFQSRFLVFNVSPPTDAEIRTLLQKLSAGGLTESVISKIAAFACGNVRQALLDADAALVSNPTQPSLLAA
jgi:DNA polymerase III delta prime subunit